jgi:hypothetical protein
MVVRVDGGFISFLLLLITFQGHLISTCRRLSIGDEPWTNVKHLEIFSLKIKLAILTQLSLAIYLGRKKLSHT